MEAGTSCEADGRELWSTTASPGEVIQNVFRWDVVVGVQERLGKGKR